MATEVINSAQTGLKKPASVGAARSIPVVESMPANQQPKVHERKPVEIRVDTEAMKANLKESIQKLNESMRDGGRNLNFHIDDKVGGPVVLVKNADTGEVVRQIPNEAVVRIAHSIEDFKGLLHNKLT